MSIWQWCFAEGLKEAFWVLQCFRFIYFHVGTGQEK